jgi:hypothetical protein
MINPITFERWQEAQIAERKQHTKSLEEGIHHYRISYSHNFRYLGINPEALQTGITEIGCADFPALRYCNIGTNCVIVEPMPSIYLGQFCRDNGIKLIINSFEDLRVPQDIPHRNDSEIWLFNVLQHVADPEKFIWKAKLSKTIRYFEPIETEITDYHPHAFTNKDFDRWFPKVNRYYNETTNQCFHNGPCCYGVWHRDSK